MRIKKKPYKIDKEVGQSPVSYCQSRLPKILLRGPERCRISKHTAQACRHDRVASHTVLGNEKGVALAMVLILSAISLAIMAALVYMLTAGTQISGAQKRYKTALEAGIGSSDILFQVISERLADPVAITARFPFLTNIATPTGDACMTEKLLSSTSGWGNCAAAASTMVIDPGDDDTYDMSFQIGAGPTYTAYAKIVDTVAGNSGADLGLTKGVLIPSGSSEIVIQSRPYLYTIEVETRNSANPAERARLSVLYEY